MTSGVVSGPTCRKKENQTVRLCTVCCSVDVCDVFLPHPAAIFTPGRLSFIPVFALCSDGCDSDSGVDGFDAWFYNGLHNKVVCSSVSCSVSGTQHPGIFLLCVKITDVFMHKNTHTHTCRSHVGKVKLVV